MRGCTTKCFLLLFISLLSSLTLAKLSPNSGFPKSTPQNAKNAGGENRTFYGDNN